jgi:eukaryotic-like serine/threonine-protein kinase
MVGTVQAEATSDPLLGATLADRYQVTRLIGRGGMGVVYEAVHVALGKRVAVKLLLDKYADDREAVERFHREALTATQIGDDHIIDVIDVGTTREGKSFVVLELLDGHDLGKVLASTGPMPGSRAVHIIQQILRGLGAAHAKGIVHRDMKPDNVFIVPHSETSDFVKILDFGISKIMAAQDAKVRLTATGTVVGTPIYMAPEQAMGSGVDHRADLYSVGVMMYELLAGRPPFVAESYLALVTQHLQAVPPDLAVMRPDLPAALVNVVHRALAKEPDQRFRNAEEFARALPPPHALRQSEAMGITYGSGLMPHAGTPERRPVAAVVGPSTARDEVVGRGGRRRLVVGALLAVAALAAVAVAVVMATKRDAAPAATTGVLKVETTPSGVSVFVDDELVGTTPIVLPDVAAGKHRVRLERDGFVSMSTSTSVAPGENASIIVAMAAADGTGPGPNAGSAGAPAATGTNGGSAAPSTSEADRSSDRGRTGRRGRPRAGTAGGSGDGTVDPYGDGGAGTGGTGGTGAGTPGAGPTDGGKTDAGKTDTGKSEDKRDKRDGRSKDNPYSSKDNPYGD